MGDYVSRRRVLTAVGGLSTIVSLAGCSGDGSPATDTPEPALSVAKFVFCAEQPAGYDDYTEQEGPTYALDDTVWLYVDVRHLGSQSAGDDKIGIDLTESLEVVGPSGETILDEELAFDNEFAAGVDLRTFFIVNDIHLPSDAAAGGYEVAVSLEDRITGDTANVSGTFTAEPSG